MEKEQKEDIQNENLAKEENNQSPELRIKRMITIKKRKKKKKNYRQKKRF